MDHYDPDGDLSKFLSDNSSQYGFDLIEMDSARLKEVVDKDLVIPITDESFLDAMWQESLIKDIFLPAAKQAVILDNSVYGFPTLACGNFLMSFTPYQVNLTDFQTDYDSLQSVLNELKEKCVGTCKRVVGGNMNGEKGRYLPSLYLDAYVDVYKPSSLQSVVLDLLAGHVDTVVCKHLSWFIGNCNDMYGQNKCYHTFEGSYINNTDNVYLDIENGETSIYLGYSERVAQIERDSKRRATAAISWPLGPHNIPLQFTDALVINKARWTEADDDKRKAIGKFIGYFLSDSLRYDIAMGTDLDEPRPLYLLPATNNFYHQTNNQVYRQLFNILLNAMPSPRLTRSEKYDIEQLLVDKCVRITSEIMKEEL